MRFEEALRIGYGCLGPGGAESLRSPLADTGSGDLVHVERAEGQEDVQVQEMLVQVLRAYRQLPLLGILPEVHGARVGSAPVAPAGICLDLGEPDLGALLGLGGPGARTRSPSGAR
ncbi:hypothetical protein GCM10010297_38790 [Streptomyces malachitofuscus]|nr:hypothetical protein GCM10010297_38790 [Streptomyces malachitofuscus]